MRNNWANLDVFPDHICEELEKLCALADNYVRDTNDRAMLIKAYGLAKFLGDRGESFFDVTTTNEYRAIADAVADICALNDAFDEDRFGGTKWVAAHKNLLEKCLPFEPFIQYGEMVDTPLQERIHIKDGEPIPQELVARFLDMSQLNRASEFALQITLVDAMMEQFASGKSPSGDPRAYAARRANGPQPS